MSHPARELVAAALTSRDAAQTCGAMLARLRIIFDAERGALARSAALGADPVVVYGDPPPTQAARLDGDAVRQACHSEQPLEVAATSGRERLLVMALRPVQDVPWCLALGRTSPWAAADRDALADLAPFLELLLGHALLQRQVAEAGGKDAAFESARERFLAILSHELRNPLAPILMWTSTLKRLRVDDNEVQRAMQAIEHAVSLERRLIEDIIDVSRLERGMVELRREPLDLRAAVQQAVELHQRQAEGARLSLQADLPAGATPVEADPKRLAQVLGNLLGNAIKFTPPGGTIAIALTPHDGVAKIRVSDSGPGIPADVLPRLFLPFTQGSNARGGLGVGLAVARWLLALHGGTIEALASGRDGGATFTITLPLAAPRP